MQHETPHKLSAIKPYRALAALVIGPHREHNVVFGDSANALMANRRAVRVAAQVRERGEDDGRGGGFKRSGDWAAFLASMRL